ncbi:MAG TPA: hypothetical protein VGY76_04775 [Solirubrobacteraceae bacterium]|nr:hypothetical protein [Solirubrobacteraceae bacterium]
MLLIISNSGDATADRTCRILQEDGVAYRRLNTDSYPESVGLVLGDDRALLSLADGALDLESVTAVWWRRPVPPVPLGRDPAVAAWAAAEAHAALDAVVRTIPRHCFVNHPDANRSAERKPLVLRSAARAGLMVPAWLITNDVPEAQSFVAAQGDAVVKALVAGRIDQARSLWTTQVGPDEILSLGPEPYLLQHFIPRAFDVRVTVFDGDCVAVRIDVDDPVAVADWRRADPDRVTYSVCELPTRERSGLESVVEEYGLRFATADIAVDTHGEWWFLEINPNGQWAWLEERTPVDLTGRLVRTLTGATSTSSDIEPDVAGCATRWRNRVKMAIFGADADEINEFPYERAELEKKLNTDDPDLAAEILDEARETWATMVDGRVESVERRAATLQGVVAIAATFTLTGGTLIIRGVHGRDWRGLAGVALLACVTLLALCGWLATQASSQYRRWVIHPRKAVFERPRQVTAQARVARAASFLYQAGNNSKHARWKVTKLRKAVSYLRLALAALVVFAALMLVYAVAGPQPTPSSSGAHLQPTTSQTSKTLPLGAPPHDQHGSIWEKRDRRLPIRLPLPKH